MSLYDRIKKEVIQKQHASMSMFVFEFGVTIERALELLDQLEAGGVIGAEDAEGQRTVLIGGGE